MKVLPGIFWISKLHRCLKNVSSEEHLKSNYNHSWQMPSGKICQKPNPVNLLYHLFFTDSEIFACHRLRILSVRDAKSNSRFQIGSIDLYAKTCGAPRMK